MDLNLYVSVELPHFGRGLPLAELTAALVTCPSLEVAYPETWEHDFEPSQL